MNRIEENDHFLGFRVFSIRRPSAFRTSVTVSGPPIFRWITYLVLRLRSGVRQTHRYIESMTILYVSGTYLPLITDEVLLYYTFDESHLSR